MEQQTLEGSGTFVSPEERMRLLGFCLGMTGNRDAAEDLVQETLLEAWLHEQALRDASKRAQWLSGIARNVCLRWLRRRGRDAAHLVEFSAGSDASEILPADLENMLADDLDIEVELERKELVELLDRAMALLPAATRAVLVKRYVEESPLAELAEQLGTNTSAVAMRLQRGKLALRRVLTTELRQEIAPYSLISTADDWAETPIWCHLCGRHRLQGKRDTNEGKLLFKCPHCSPGPNELLSYNELPVLKGIKGYKPLVSRLKNWCEQNYRAGLRDGSIVCEGCGRRLPIYFGRLEDSPEWVQNREREGRFGGMWQTSERVVMILCAPCRAVYRTTLDSLALCLAEGRRFLQAHPRIRTLPSQEVESEGRRAILSRFESLTDNARLTVISDYETGNVLYIDGCNQ